MKDSKIQWTDNTWNPVRGCSRVSEGCRNCYAERQAARFADVTKTRDGQFVDAPFHGFVRTVNGHPQWTGKVELVEKHLLDPLHWRKPCRVFVNSMSDLFHEALPDEAIDRVFAVMALCPQHTFQILTKRPERMRIYFESFWEPKAQQRGFNTCEWLMSVGAIKPAPEDEARVEMVCDIPKGLPNVWLGVSVEDQKTADERIPPLLMTPTAKRFVSYEPALSDVDFELGRGFLSGETHDDAPWLGRRLDWVIVGGESGPGARPFDVAWARSTIRQCKEAGVAVFFKQAGALPMLSSGDRDWGSDWPEGTRFGNRTGKPEFNGRQIFLRDRKGGDMESA